MIRIIAVVFGIVFIFAGVAGFLPTFLHDGLLFGYFEINAIHNMLYIVSGVLAIMAATSFTYTRRYFITFGLLYACIAGWGFMRDGDFSFILMHMNTADNVLHTVIAILALYFGFSKTRQV